MALTPSDLEMLADNVLVLTDPPEGQEGSILLSDNGKVRSRRGTVIAVGPGRKAKKTRLLIPGSMEVKPGDRVIFGFFAEKYGCDDMKIGEQKYMVCTNDDIYAVEDPN